MQQVYTYYPNFQHTFKTHIIRFPFIKGIRNYISKKKIAFMVMGTKGATGLKEMTIGSKATVVITRIQCPNLVIPESARFKKPLDIGFPTDFNICYQQKVIKTLVHIAKNHQPSIRVLHD